MLPIPMHLLKAKGISSQAQVVIINGCIRDIDEIRQTLLGVKALGIHPMKTDKRDLGDINLDANLRRGRCYPRPVCLCRK